VAVGAESVGAGVHVASNQLSDGGEGGRIEQPPDDTVPVFLELTESFEVERRGSAVVCHVAVMAQARA
jgi:hypothetical protein